MLEEILPSGGRSAAVRQLCQFVQPGREGLEHLHVSEADTVRVNEGIQAGQPLLLFGSPGAAVFPQRHEPVREVGKVPDSWSRRGRVEVDERG